jgi:hypothetical protein
VECVPLEKLELEDWKNHPGGSHVNATYTLLLALTERHTPEQSQDVFNYKELDPEISDAITILDLAVLFPSFPLLPKKENMR